MTRILHVINNLGPGGAEKLLDELLPLMNEEEHIQADLLLLSDQLDVFQDSLVSKGVKVSVIPFNRHYDIRNIFQIKNHIIKGGYDIVHAHTFPTQLWVALARMLMGHTGIKFMTTEHSTHNRRRDKFYFKAVDKLIYAQYDAIISISQKTKDSLVSWINTKGVALHKHLVIENGVDVAGIQEAVPYEKEELVQSLDSQAKLLCMVGRFYEAKDQATVIKAMPHIPPAFHLLLVGQGPLQSEHMHLVKELGLGDRVHFLGFRHDIPRILKTADLVVLSSHWEGLSLASIEGMASGSPFIASRVPGLEEMVEGHGILFEQGNPNDLAEAVNRLAGNSVLYQATAQRCLQQAQKYELKNTKRRLLDVYQELIQI